MWANCVWVELCVSKLYDDKLYVWASCVWVELCVSKLYDDKLYVWYVSKLCVSWVVCEQVVCELCDDKLYVWWREAAGGGGGGGIQNQKQEPHTKMWGNIYLWGQQPARLIHLYFRVPEAGSMCGTRFSGLVAKRHLSFAMRWGVSLLQYLRIPQNEHGWISTVCGMNTLSLELVSPPAKSAANKSSGICILLPLQLWNMNESVDAFLAFFQVDTCWHHGTL